MAREIDLIERCRDALLEAGYPEVRLSPLIDGREGVAIRELPSTVIRSYFDGTRDMAVPVEVLARRHRQDEAIALASRASDVLTNTDLSSVNSSYLFSIAEPYTGPTLTSQPTDGLYAYAAGVRVIITTIVSDFD